MTKRVAILAILAGFGLAACTPPEITSRLDTAETLYAGFEDTNRYTAAPIGARAENDFMRFSTQAMPGFGPQ